MARGPAKRTPRAAPRQARPAPRAEAAEPARSSFYDPQGSDPAPTSQLGAPAPAEDFAFTAMARHEAIELEDGLSGDAEIDGIDSEAPDIEDREAYRQHIERIKAVRKPLGAYNLKLDLPRRRGYHRHWFIDAAGRVDMAISNGWSHVKGRDGKPLRRNAGRGPQSASQFAFAMEIPLVFWEEDQAFKHKLASERVDAIRQRPAVAKSGESKPEDRGKFYNPHEDVDPVSISKSNPTAPI